MLVLSGVLAILLAACQSGQESSSPEKEDEVEMVSGAANDILPSDELAKQIALANSGDQPAHAKLEWHYYRTGDMKQYRYWLEHGAAGDNPASMQRLATDLSLEGGPENCRRAIDLLEHAREKVKESNPEFYTDIGTSLKVLRGEIEGMSPCK